MSQQLFVNQKSLTLDPAQLIQSGGEGMVFAWGQLAVKIYHQPQLRHRQKLDYWLNSGLARKMPAQILAPQTVVQDAQGQVIGFVMGKMPAAVYPIKQLANPHFTNQQRLTLHQIISLLSHAHTTLCQLHQLGVIVGDLNDHNLFAQWTNSQNLPTYWVDTDSYQLGGYPCPVALESFLDPHLYGIANFSQQPSFSELTDWYAFAVLLVKSLLQLHPYGGSHHTYKSLKSRAIAQISILNSGVTYPQNARPLEILSDGLLHEINRLFEKGERFALPLSLLVDYEQSLVRCRHCTQLYPAQRTYCPICQRRNPAILPNQQKGAVQFRLLLETEGVICHVAVQSGGRMAIIVRQGDEYRLVRAGMGGVLENRSLFSAQAEYRFAWLGSQICVVNRAGTSRLLLFDLSQPTPRQLAMLETAIFQEQAVFAATDQHLYRLANGYVMRGQLQQGLFVEEIATDARRNQTRLWANCQQPVVVGCYRLFADYHFFLLTPKGRVELPPLPLLAGSSLNELNVAISQDHVALLLKTIFAGQEQTETRLYNYAGQLQEHWVHAATDAAHWDSVLGKALIYGTLLHPTDAGILKENVSGQTLLTDTAGHPTSTDQLYSHPAGLLLHQPHQLWLLHT